ncbi:hypothetical protein BASA81_008382 [Batrachochytrium salamandrivorans]|nr:hypothetical protein BASA81_008382 [Batrachochytrium salamandrivorans]
MDLGDHLPVAAHRLLESNLVANTRDYEDHTFSGIIFILEARNVLPIDFVEVHSIAVRGRLGRMSVYSSIQMGDVSSPNFAIDLLRNCVGKPEQWNRNYGPKLVDNVDYKTMCDLVLDSPIRLHAGESLAVYVHSEARGDQALVYDDQRGGEITFQNDVIRILPGVSHTSHVPHSNINHWGGNAWRMRRGFVGQIKYGAKHFLWTPRNQQRFSASFTDGVRHLLLCQYVLNRRAGGELNFGALPLDCLFTIINFLPWDAFGGALINADGEEEEEEDDDFETIMQRNLYRHFARAYAGQQLVAGDEDDIEVDDEDDVDEDDEENDSSYEEDEDEIDEEDDE